MVQGAGRWASRATRWVMVAVGTAVSVTACTGGGPEPGPASTLASPIWAPPTAPSTASASPTPSAPTEPAKPASWTTGDDEAAVDAAAYFLDLYNYVIATGDLTEWDALADPECQFCTHTHDDVTSAFSTGGRLEGGRLRAAEPTLVGYSTTLHIHAVQFSYVTEPAALVAADGSTTSSSGSESGYAIVDVGFIGDRWILVETAARDEPVAPETEAR
ncbi:DUF6318 family protein [Isoptericola sp. b441]|uniref:DUF6318 family protein n=1 Tax=Actinotalea lenta TaxID=3064654 RepID=A0ABT9DEY7_9CELL|nr:DUF6318 family protein [Isoptericola sp. b441]MDO8108356.1 DUF6318 family protein [Isoptericola sp. b441]